MRMAVAERYALWIDDLLAPPVRYGRAVYSESATLTATKPFLYVLNIPFALDLCSPFYTFPFCLSLLSNIDVVARHRLLLAPLFSFPFLLVHSILVRI